MAFCSQIYGNRMILANTFFFKVREVTRKCTDIQVSPRLGKQFVEEGCMGYGGTLESNLLHDND